MESSSSLAVQAVGEFGHQGRLTRAGFAAQEDGTVAVVGQAREEGGDVCLSAVETAPAPAGDFEMAAVLSSGGCSASASAIRRSMILRRRIEKWFSRYRSYSPES